MPYLNSSAARPTPARRSCRVGQRHRVDHHGARARAAWPRPRPARRRWRRPARGDRPARCRAAAPSSAGGSRHAGSRPDAARPVRPDQSGRDGIRGRRRPAPTAAPRRPPPARHRAGGVLHRRYRHDAGAADQAAGGLEADDAAGAGRARRSSRRSRCRPRAAPGPAATAAAEPELDPDGLRSRAYGLAVWPAERGPAAGGVGRAEVRPLRQVGLAEDHRAGRAQPGDRNASAGSAVEQRGRARRGRHARRPGCCP